MATSKPNDEIKKDKEVENKQEDTSTAALLMKAETIAKKVRGSPLNFSVDTKSTSDTE